MSFAEVDIFGVYVARLSLILVAAWLGTIVIRQLAGRLGLLRFVWHPPLFMFAIYVILVSSITIAAAVTGS